MSEVIHLGKLRIPPSRRLHLTATRYFSVFCTIWCSPTTAARTGPTCFGIRRVLQRPRFPVNLLSATGKHLCQSLDCGKLTVHCRLRYSKMLVFYLIMPLCRVVHRMVSERNRWHAVIVPISIYQATDYQPSYTFARWICPHLPPPPKQQLSLFILELLLSHDFEVSPGCCYFLVGYITSQGYGMWCHVLSIGRLQT